jgi:hypothetical protein
MAWVTPTNVATGDVLTASKWNQDVVENTAQLYASQRRLAYQTRTSSLGSTATTVATASDIFSSDLTWTAAGSVTYWIEFYVVRTQVAAGATYGSYSMVDGSGTDLGTVALMYTASLQVPMFVKVPYTPSAGSVSVNFRLITNAGTTNLIAGAGGAGADMPAWAAVYGPDLT